MALTETRSGEPVLLLLHCRPRLLGSAAWLWLQRGKVSYLGPRYRPKGLDFSRTVAFFSHA